MTTEAHTDILLEVACDQTGDSAEARDEASLLVAARELCADAWHDHPFQGFSPTVTFYVDGEPVQRAVPERSVWAALAVAA